MSLSQKLNKIFLIFFSKIFLEKPHLVYTYNLRYFVCTFIRLDWFAAQLSFLSWPWYWFIWKQTIFQTFKMSPSILFSFKNHPSPPPPAQCCYGWFKERFLLGQQVWKIKSNIKYREKGKERQCTVKNQFF